MPTEVERIAKQYLRHPVIIKIGDEESGKNKRIEQRVLFITEGQKKSKLVEELRNLISNEKV
jgi:ATP-dependent RNA helicase DDX23/PRP28